MVISVRKLVLIGLAALSLTLGLMAFKAPAQAAPPLQLTPFPTPTPGPDGRIIYIVQKNDTLWRISAITGVSLERLRSLNKLGESDTLQEGQQLLIGFAGPLETTPTPGPSPTPTSILPTATPLLGTGTICVILYNDVNGNGMREEEEVWIVGGQISVSNRSGSVSETAETQQETTDTGETKHHCFEDLPEGDYNITVAAPQGYNPVTILSRALRLNGGDESYLSFGAQANTEKIIETAVIPVSPRKSPLLGIVGGALLLIGVVLGIYAFFLARK